MTEQEKMFALVEKWELSNIPKSQFARMHNLKESEFHRWIFRHRRQKTDRDKTKDAVNFFTIDKPVIVKSSNTKKQKNRAAFTRQQSSVMIGSGQHSHSEFKKLEINLANGIRITIY